MSVVLLISFLLVGYTGQDETRWVLLPLSHPDLTSSTAKLPWAPQGSLEVSSMLFNLPSWKVMTQLHSGITWKGVVPICPSASEGASEASLLARCPEGKTFTRRLSDPTLWEVGCHGFFGLGCIHPLTYPPQAAVTTSICSVAFKWYFPNWHPNRTGNSLYQAVLCRFNQVGEFQRSLIRLTTF